MSTLRPEVIVIKSSEYSRFLQLFEHFERINQEIGHELLSSPDSYIKEVVKRLFKTDAIRKRAAKCKPGRWMSRGPNVASLSEGDLKLGGLVLVAGEHFKRLRDGEIPRIGWEHVSSVCVTRASERENRDQAKSRLIDLLRHTLTAQPMRMSIIGTIIFGEDINVVRADRQLVKDFEAPTSIIKEPLTFLAIIVDQAAKVEKEPEYEYRNVNGNLFIVLP